MTSCCKNGVRRPCRNNSSPVCSGVMMSGSDAVGALGSVSRCPLTSLQPLTPRPAQEGPMGARGGVGRDTKDEKKSLFSVPKTGREQRKLQHSGQVWPPDNTFFSGFQWCVRACVCACVHVRKCLNEGGAPKVKVNAPCQSLTLPFLSFFLLFSFLRSFSAISVVRLSTTLLPW